MLKYFALFVALTLIIFSGCSKNDSQESNDDARQLTSYPKYAAELTCYIGKIGSGGNCNTIIFDPNKPENRNITITNRSISFGTEGQVSKISWKFIEHYNENDIYTFTRLFPSDINNYTTSTKAIEFNGEQKIIFEDEFHVIVLDTPKQ